MAGLGKVLPSRLINIAVPVNFFHLERAFGNFAPFPKDPDGFKPVASVGFAWPEADVLLDEDGWTAGLISVDATPEEEIWPEAIDAEGEAGIGLRADCWTRVAWLANGLNGFYRILNGIRLFKLITEQGWFNVHNFMFLISIGEFNIYFALTTLCCRFDIFGI